MAKPCQTIDVSAIVRSRPVNRVAARVTAPGPRGFDLRQRPEVCSPIPLATKAIPADAPNLIGLHCGSLTVVGLGAERNKCRNRGRWVCRCACGYYTHRSAKALRNAANQDDCCPRCEQVRYLRRATRDRALGFHADDE